MNRLSTVSISMAILDRQRAHSQVLPIIMSIRRWLGPLAVACCLCSGCSKSPFDLAPVHGTVAIDGRPMTHGKVMFAPAARNGDVDAGKPAFGVIGQDGSFVLSTYGDGDGAIVGEHSATVINIPTGDAPETSQIPTGQRIPKFKRVLVPGKFSVVAGQDNQIDIRLTSRDISQFGS
jgi:hypothetical protein